jgi:hypothetical protein
MGEILKVQALCVERRHPLQLTLVRHRHQMVGILVLEEQLTLVRHRFALVQHQLDYAVVGPPYRLVAEF